MRGTPFKRARAYRSTPETSIFGEATVETEKLRDQFVKSGNDYYDQGKFREAIKCHCEALKIAERLEDKIEEARSRGNIGNAYRSLGDFKEAIEYHNGELEIANTLTNGATGDTKYQTQGLEILIDAYGNLGTDYFCLGDFSKAKEHHLKETSEADELNDKELIGKANCRLGTDYYCLNNFLEGKKCHKIHRDYASEMKDMKELGLAYGNIGIGFRKIGEFQKAKDCHEEELKIAKETGNKAGEVKSLLNLGNVYRGLRRFGDAKCCHQEGFELAKEMSEKVVCGDALYKLGRDFECEGSHLEKAVKNYQESVDCYNEVRESLKGKDNWAISFRDSHQKAYTALWRTLLRLDRTNDALSAVEQGRAQALVDLLHLRHGVQKPDLPEEIIQSCTAPGKISTQTVYFAIESNTIHFWVLGIEKGVQCRQFKLNVATVLQRILETAERHSFDSLRNMYDLIIAPIRDLLQDGDLIIVPDGPLFLVPYNVLQHGEKKETEYLFEKFSIRIVPSLTSLKLISDKDNSSKSGVLLVGAPNHVGLPKLKYAKKEVQSIKKLLEKETQNVTTLIGGQATKEAVKDKIGSVALIHIAAHATKETGEIELTGSDRLTISDVQQANARLVVLSCCYSGQGKITADGVVGIARAFLGAGAHSVLMTLWEIHDRVSMLIMKEFYKLLVERKNASEALNETLKYCKTQYDVKYWAPFVLIGDDVALEFDKQNESMVRIYFRLK